MKHSHPYLIESILKKLKVLTNYKEEKTKLLSESISLYLQKLTELKNYVNEDNLDNESKIFFEIGKYLKYAKYQKGQFIRHSYESDDYFYMIFTGDVAKIDIKYNRLYLSFREYLIHLIKLRLLGENHIYLKCIRKNQKIFPFDENMDILTTTDINIDHYPELIKKIKKDIYNSYWFTNDDKNNNIEDFLKLYNPEIKDIKSAFLGKETKFPTYLPFYTFDQIMNPISFIGHLTKPKNIRFISSYICLNISDIFYVDKTEIHKDNNLFKLFQRRISENVIKKLFEKHFIFKDTDKSFLIKNYSQYFYSQKYKKGEKLIKQNTPHEGIYFINSGIFQLKTFRSYNELNDLHFSILHALDNFPKALMDFQSRINDFEKQNKKNNSKNIFEGLTQNQISKFTQLKNILFNSFVSPDVVGLNDVYDNKTGLNNFSVECVSEDAEVYFVPNEIVTSMMTEENINTKISEFIGKQCMLLISEINKYKDSFEKVVKLEINNNNENKHINNNNNTFYSSLHLSNTENNKNYMMNYKPKKNYSTGYDSISNMNSNYSTSKITTYSNYYFNTYNGNKINNKSLKTINRNMRYENLPNIFLSKIFKNNNNDNNDNNGNNSLIKIKIDMFNDDNNYDKKYKTNLKFFNVNGNTKDNFKKNLHNSYDVYLTDRDAFNIQNNFNEENKNEFNSIKNKFENINTTNSNINTNTNTNNNLTFNNRNKKRKKKKFRSQKNSGKYLIKYSEQNKNKIGELKYLKSEINKKRLDNKKFIMRFIEK